MVLVTHDRYLLGRVADSLLRIHEGRAEFREGGYEDNQAWVDLDVGHEPGAEEPEAPPEPPGQGQGGPQGGRDGARAEAPAGSPGPR